VIGKNTFLGANCVVTAPSGRTLTIGEGAVVTTCAVITSSVPAYTMVGNEKAKRLANVTVPLTMDTSYESFMAGLRPLERR
jgi:acetyltransferase-like isoleucine patch superfamily enzyme